MKDVVALLEREIERRRGQLDGMRSGSVWTYASQLREALAGIEREPENQNHYAQFRLRVDLLADSLDRAQALAQEIGALRRALDVVRARDEEEETDGPATPVDPV